MANSGTKNKIFLTPPTPLFGWVKKSIFYLIYTKLSTFILVLRSHVGSKFYEESKKHFYIFQKSGKTSNFRGFSRFLPFFAFFCDFSSILRHFCSVTLSKYISDYYYKTISTQDFMRNPKNTSKFSRRAEKPRIFAIFHNFCSI